jgi:hypothetical protein
VSALQSGAGGGREPARVFAAHDEVAGGGVVYVGSWRSDGHGALGVVLVVATVEDDGHGYAAAVGVGGVHVVEGQAFGDHKGRPGRGLSLIIIYNTNPPLPTVLCRVNKIRPPRDRAIVELASRPSSRSRSFSVRSSALAALAHSDSLTDDHLKPHVLPDSPAQDVCQQ